MDDHPHDSESDDSTEHTDIDMQDIESGSSEFEPVTTEAPPSSTESSKEYGDIQFEVDEDTGGTSRMKQAMIGFAIFVVMFAILWWVLNRGD